MSSSTLVTSQPKTGTVQVPKITNTRRKVWVPRLLTLVLLASVWELLLAVGVLPIAAPSIVSILTAIGAVILSTAFWQALGQTLWGAAAGWTLAATVGTVLGIAIGTSGFLSRSTSVIVEFGRAFPMLAIMPVVVLVIGVNSRMEIMMIFLSCLWPILVQAIEGSRRQDQSVADTVEAFRIPAWLKFRKVTLPAALPLISTGLRIAASIAILVSVGVGVLSQTPGLGRQITLAQEASRWDLAFAYLLFAALVGWGINSSIAAAEKGALKWNRQEL